MQQELTRRIRDNPKFQELTRKRTAFGWQLAILMLVIYYSFILVVAFSPKVLGTPIAAGSPISIGLPLGALIILVAFSLTGLYVWRANSEFDRLNREIIEETR